MNDGAQTYALLRNFADSWGLVGMLISFTLACVWPFLPGGRKTADHAANMIFEDDENGQ
ncbi:CcoQ/FixQ family Cbb3-type cytochrome c oxidase assembly chaperone [Novosphingobium sp. FSY-8]|uniref:CcoQ/FixQ family Cbb3-type cytochrome c oxidase assembly chaperone n=1 Tax=Novosphingobium ovatum TaxID=1908523 RepID=A0ABW9XG10_9SPHN|nr:cbb3-type cytochrome c oxidase subunit 3 [Novosphingobium ovatum]NBC37479.1 CcoQ/FixQ family Cbb3-type cytochrome c oxidase assembly chaperone [Novosphingobium ovatum]